ncbi:MAG: gliding motility-associated C-terminal domain-containing protein [Bacteroidota bacterium]
MKHILITLIVFCCFFQQTYAQDLPPAVPNLQTIATGSYIIPMDQAKQSVVQSEISTGLTFEGFNLAAYGLVYQLLDNGIPVKWVIRAGKDKDEVDFSAMAARRFPTSQSALFHTFLSSAFVVDIDNVITETCNGGTSTLQQVNQIIQQFGRQVAVYELMEDTDMDVRYVLNFPPRIAVLNDGGFASAHTLILNQADIPFTEIGSAEFFQDFSCFTTISQPHLEDILNPSYIPSLNDFLNSGGNFIAQCSAIDTFEDPGLFMTTTGVDFEFMGCENLSYSYDNNDMAFMQFEGNLASDIFGTISSFSLSPGSAFKPSTYEGVRNQQNKIVGLAADVNGAVAGGNMFYLGGHEFTSGFIGGCFPSPIIQLQAIVQTQRLYLNTLFVPTSISFACAGNDICICPGGSVQLGCDNLVVSPGVTYSWSPAAGLDCTDCPNPMATPDVTTTYTLTVTSGLGNTCTDPSSVTVEVLDQISIENVSFECDDTNSSYNIQFTISGGNTGNLQVTGINGTLSGNLFTSEFIPSNTDFMIEVSGPAGCFDSIEGSFGCCPATVNIDGGGQVCIDGPVPVDLVFEFEGTPDWTFEYAIDGVVQPAITTSASPFIITTDVPGIYSLVSIEDSECIGLSSGETSIIMVNNPLPFDLGEDQSFCEGKAFILDATQPNVAYEWQDGSTESTFSVTESGTYAVTVTNVCGSESDEITVGVIPSPDPFSLPNDTTICNTESILLMGPDGDLDYEWQDGSTAPFFIANTPGTYTLTVSNECGSESDEFTLDFFSCVPCFVAVPNAFTPNFDGINDTFFPDAFQCDFLTYELKVFDRWGELLFASTDPDAKWDGYFRGRKMQIGVYVWMLNYSYNLRGETLVFAEAGDVTIIR